MNWRLLGIYRCSHKFQGRKFQRASLRPCLQNVLLNYFRYFYSSRFTTSIGNSTDAVSYLFFQSVYFKLRKMIPCALCDMQFKLALPEPDEIQFTVIGMALGLGDPVKMNKLKKKLMTHSVSKDQVKKSGKSLNNYNYFDRLNNYRSNFVFPDDSDMIFNLDVDHNEISSDNASSSVTVNSSNLINAVGLKSRTRSPLRSKIHTIHKHKHVSIHVSRNMQQLLVFKNNLNCTGAFERKIRCRYNPSVLPTWWSDREIFRELELFLYS